jgi:hypothetical protein
MKIGSGTAWFTLIVLLSFPPIDGGGGFGGAVGAAFCISFYI